MADAFDPSRLDPLSVARGLVTQLVPSSGAAGVPAPAPGTDYANPDNWVENSGTPAGAAPLTSSAGAPPTVDPNGIPIVGAPSATIEPTVPADMSEDGKRYLAFALRQAEALKPSAALEEQKANIRLQAAERALPIQKEITALKEREAAVQREVDLHAEASNRARQDAEEALKAPLKVPSLGSEMGWIGTAMIIAAAGFEGFAGTNRVNEMLERQAQNRWNEARQKRDLRYRTYMARYKDERAAATASKLEMTRMQERARELALRGGEIGATAGVEQLKLNEAFTQRRVSLAQTLEQQMTEVHLSGLKAAEQERVKFESDQARAGFDVSLAGQKAGAAAEARERVKGQSVTAGAGAEDLKNAGITLEQYQKAASALVNQQPLTQVIAERENVAQGLAFLEAEAEKHNGDLTGVDLLSIARQPWAAALGIGGQEAKDNRAIVQRIIDAGLKAAQGSNPSDTDLARAKENVGMSMGQVRSYVRLQLQLADAKIDAAIDAAVPPGAGEATRELIKKSMRRKPPRIVMEPDERPQQGPPAPKQPGFLESIGDAFMRSPPYQGTY
jgi:hypothetical protein